MKKRMWVAVVLICVLAILVGCGTRGKTLREVVTADHNALAAARDGKIVCKDYTVEYQGGMEDSINATRYASGMVEVTDRFVDFHWVIVDNSSGWKYIFESYNDMVPWAMNS